MISDGDHRPGVPQFAPGRLGGSLTLVVATAAIGLSALLPEAVTGALRYERGPLAAHEWWRLITAHVVHLGWAHAGMNAAALLLIAWIARGGLLLREWCVIALAAAAAIDAGLYWLQPGVAWYLGASGVLHGLFAGAAVLLAARGRGREAAIMVAALVTKIAYEAHTGQGLAAMGGSDFPVLTRSHLYGAIGGLTAGLTLLPFGRAYNPASNMKTERRT